jgi:hypothetical protein
VKTSLQNSNCKYQIEKLPHLSLLTTSCLRFFPCLLPPTFSLPTAASNCQRFFIAIAIATAIANCHWVFHESRLSLPASTPPNDLPRTHDTIS